MPVDEFVEVEENYDRPTGAPIVENRVRVTDELLRILRERQGAYARIFAGASKDDVKIVMEDLAEFCRAYRTPFTLEERSTILLLGRLEVYQRIVEFARLSNDELFYNYHERALKKAHGT